MEGMIIFTSCILNGCLSHKKKVGIDKRRDEKIQQLICSMIGVN